MTTEQTLSAKLDARPATFTCDKSKVGPLYYFAITDRAPGPYKTQRHVEAILDIASDGTLAGVELIDNMPPPPALAQSIRTTEAGAPKVKLLEWVDGKAKTAQVTYAVKKTMFGWSWVAMTGVGAFASKPCAATEDEAKALAQAHHNQAILSALERQP